MKMKYQFFNTRFSGSSYTGHKILFKVIYVFAFPSHFVLFLVLKILSSRSRRRIFKQNSTKKNMLLQH